MDTTRAKRSLQVDDLKKLELISWPEWNSTGEEIAYVIKRWDKESGKAIPEVRLQSIAETISHPITPNRDRITGSWHPLYSPDGKLLAFLCDASGSPQIWICERDGSGLRKLTSQKNGVIDFCWAPDSQSLSFTTPSGEDKVSTDSRKVEVSLETGTEEAANFSWKLHHEPRYFTELPYHKDTAKEDTGITESSHRCPHQVSADGSYVYYLSAFRGTRQLFRCPASDDRAAELSEQVTDLPYTIADFCLPKADADQDQILLLLTDDTTPIDLYLYSQKKKKARRIGFHNAWLQEVTLSVPLLLQMETKRSADADSPENPGSVQGWVMPRISRQEEVPKHSVPSFHYVPDGPEVSYTTGFDFERQAMAANGLAVIYCNPRGCACHRPDSEKESPSSYETACQDLCHFTDLALETFPWLDPDNVCIGGGWLINDICCHTDRFKAAVAQHPWSNPSTSCGIEDTDLFSQSSLGTSGLQEYLYSKARSASIVDIDCWKTPCLILHGQNDSICPLEQGEQLYSALRDRCPDVPRRMVIFPGENHEIRKTGLLHWQIRHLKEMIDWCHKYTTSENASEPTVDSSKNETAPPSYNQNPKAIPAFSAKQSRISLESLLPVDRKDQETTSGKRLPVMEDYLKMQYIGQPAAGAGFAAWTQSFQPVFEKYCDPKNTGRFREQIHLKSLPDSMLCKKEQEWILTAGGQEEHSPYIAEDGSVYFLSDASLPLPYPAVGTLEGRTVN